MQVEYPKVKAKNNNGCIFMLIALAFGFFGFMALGAVLISIPRLSSRDFNFYSFICGIPIVLTAIGIFIYGLIVAARPSQEDAQNLANFEAERQAAERAVKKMQCPKCGRVGSIGINENSLGSKGSGVMAWEEILIYDQCGYCLWRGNEFRTSNQIAILIRAKNRFSEPDHNDPNDWEEYEEPREVGKQYREWLKRHIETNGNIHYVG